MRASRKLAAALCVMLALAACGGGVAASRSHPTPSATAALVPAFTSTALVGVAPATVNGAAKTVVTDIQGFMLYYFAQDTATVSQCTEVCASEWPPLLFSGGVAPTSTTPLPGALRVVASGNGPQVQYAAHFLYTHTGEDTPGDTDGDGQLGGQWHAATTDLVRGLPALLPITANNTVRSPL
jgi:predicted lipoprotein with Yx(FWY)xxD motif